MVASFTRGRRLRFLELGAETWINGKFNCAGGNNYDIETTQNLKVV